MPFKCSICEEESTRICVYCTKDTCANHMCEKCGRCSDCCSCEFVRDTSEPAPVHPHRVEPVETEPNPGAAEAREAMQAVFAPDEGPAPLRNVDEPVEALAPEEPAAER